MKRQVTLLLAVLFFGSALARANSVPIGLVSFDAFIPASTTPGVNAFDVFNFTGPSYGPVVGPPFAADSLTFTSSVLTVTFQGGATQTFNLGDIAPGELLDTNGNPIVQFPTTDNFTSAEFTATLNPTTFTLSDGTSFTADGSITADLTPSSGSTLVAGTDFAVINAESAQVTVTPEPNGLILFVTALAGIFVSWIWKSEKEQIKKTES